MQKRQSEGALYVKLPASAVDKLDRASETLGVAKKDLIANLVIKYIDPDDKKSLNQLGATMGRYSFQPYDPPEVMNAAQVADLLALDPKVVLELAENGDLPGRKLGTEWRFSRTAIVAWLAGDISKIST